MHFVARRISFQTQDQRDVVEIRRIALFGPRHSNQEIRHTSEGCGIMLVRSRPRSTDATYT